MTELYPAAAEQEAEAHIEGNLVGAPAWPAHPQWLAKFLQVLETRIEVDSLAAG